MKITLDEKPTTRFLGNCTACVRPLAVEIDNVYGAHTYAPCAECGKTIKLPRLVAVTSQDVCDASCMGALGNKCICGCGGANHGRAWGTTTTTMQFQDALTKHRAKAAKQAVRKEKAAETKRQKVERVFTEWRESLDADDRALITWVLDYENVKDNGFLVDMRLIMITDPQGKRPAKPLTPNQLAACRRTYAGHLKYKVIQEERKAREEAEAANAKPVPLGEGITVEGTVVSVKVLDGYTYNTYSYKMLVVGDGWKVWGTIPAALGDIDTLEGVRVRFVANVELSKSRDPFFGIAKFPKKAVRLAA